MNIAWGGRQGFRCSSQGLVDAGEHAGRIVGEAARFVSTDATGGRENEQRVCWEARNRFSQGLGWTRDAMGMGMVAEGTGFPRTDTTAVRMNEHDVGCEARNRCI